MRIIKSKFIVFTLVLSIFSQSASSLDLILPKNKPNIPNEIKQKKISINTVLPKKKPSRGEKKLLKKK